jgi:hypothetical protein
MAVVDTQLSTEILKSSIEGAVLVPGDAQYDQARQGWDLSLVQHPAVIVLAKSAGDVVTAVNFARDNGLGAAVLSTGHGSSLPADDALLIVTSQMNDVRIDEETQTAWVEAGAKWGVVLAKAQAVGLAPLLGSSPDVGAVGYTLGGGFGWIGRKYGMSVDSVLMFEVVTADGQIRRASDSENSDLFWALRGGGGSFGVITGMQIKLYPLTTVVGGNLIYPIEAARDVLRHYRDWIKNAPDELTSAFAIMNLPPLDMIPEFLRGKSIVMVRGCYCGPVEQGEAMIQEWVDWMPPMANQFQAMPFSQVGKISDEPEDPVPALISTAWLTDLSDEVLDLLIQYAAPSDRPAPIISTEVRHAGGAISRVDPAANAFSNRDGEYLLAFLTMPPSPEAVPQIVQYMKLAQQAVQPHTSGRVYINFFTGPDKFDHTPDAFPPDTYRRLKSLKAQYDPGNLFHYSFNIPPQA